jgi:hypothetical protein
MYRLLFAGLLSFVISGTASAIDLQGMLTDWNCTEQMVRQGREKVLKKRRSCSLAANPRRAAYGLITDEKKFYKLDPHDNDRIIEVLSNSPNKDNLKVVISGDLNGNTVKIDTISIL